MAKTRKEQIEDFERIDISPFCTSGFDPNEYGEGDGPISYAILLHDSEFEYDYKVCKRLGSRAYYGCGHEYEQIFQDYLAEIDYAHTDELHYDSENGMFCVSSYNKDVAVEVGKILAELYKQEDKMLELIKEGNKRHCWRWW